MQKLVDSIENNDLNYLESVLDDKNFDINYRNINDESLLLIACKLGFGQIALYLISKNANVNDYDDKYKMSPLIYACMNNLVDVVEEILSLKNINLKKILEHKNIYGNNALLSSSYSMCYKIIPLLIKAGANINTVNKKGVTPLLASLTYSSPFREKIIKLLLNNGAKINVSSNSGDTCLSLAWYSEENQDIIRILIENGADPIKELNLHSNKNTLKLSSIQKK